MNVEELWAAVASSIRGLASFAWQKLSIAVVTAVASDAVGLHATLLCFFVGLVFFDLFTKWLGLAKIYLIASGTKEPTLWQSLLGIPAARGAGIINSEVMKHRFLGKIFIYMLVVIIAGIVDGMFKAVHSPAIIVNAVVCYLGLTEFISIMENLQEAGVVACGNLIMWIKNKTGMGR